MLLKREEIIVFNKVILNYIIVFLLKSKHGSYHNYRTFVQKYNITQFKTERFKIKINNDISQKNLNKVLTVFPVNHFFIAH